MHVYVMTKKSLKTLQEYLLVSHPYVQSQGYADIAELLLQIESMRNVNTTIQIQTRNTFGTVTLKNKTVSNTKYRSSTHQSTSNRSYSEGFRKKNRSVKFDISGTI